ncbi:HPr kinase/phosphorylase [Pseudotabrizicola sp. L79]|uniref:HPr kinase/phosphorylase n=1 Tax=Pseudotabrizicola sp. L79 TaxID=3118402 RepID=UPI002F959C5C
MGTALHATTVAIAGQGVLIRGASGAGKSSLALRLIGLGAVLVADDQTWLERQGDSLVASCPPTLRGLIEARGLGLLNAPFCDTARLGLVVDLDLHEPDRLPPWRTTMVEGVTLPLVLAQRTDHFAWGLMHLARHGRRE